MLRRTTALLKIQRKPNSGRDRLAHSHLARGIDALGLPERWLSFVKSKAVTLLIIMGSQALLGVSLTSALD